MTISTAPISSVEIPLDLKENPSMHIAREYQKNTKNGIINMPVQFRREFFSPAANQEILKAPITVVRILFKVLNDISYDQFVPNKDLTKVQAFDKELMTKSNTYCAFNFKVTDISEQRDYAGIKKSLEFLENYQRGWHKSKNSKGEAVTSYGGLIISSSVSSGKISFLMSNYWLEKLLCMPKYNSATTNLPWKISKIRQLLFYLWLLELDARGTQIDYLKWMKTYDYDYKNKSALIDGFFRPMKALLDKQADLSFNFSSKGQLISIVPYITGKTDIPISASASKKYDIRQKIHYWKRRHKLETQHAATLRTMLNLHDASFSIMIQSYEAFIADCRKSKVGPTSLTGSAFMLRFQKQITIEYHASIWSEIDSEYDCPIIVETQSYFT